MKFEHQPRKPSALNDWAYDTIKQAILSLHVAPGAQLHVEELTQQMGTSRTPIREALLRLEKDGLVRTVPRVGSFVTLITRRDLRELFELRALLESYAAKKAAACMTDDDLADVDRLLEQSIDAVDRGELLEFLEFEAALHASVIKGSQNRRLVQMMGSLEDVCRVHG